MSRLLDEVGRRTIDYLAGLPAEPAHSSEGGTGVARLLAEPPPEKGSPLEAILALLFDRVVPCSLNTAGPGYLAYIPGGGLYSGALAEYVAAAVNRYAGVWAAAPGAVEVETQAVRWLARLMGFPEGSSGQLTTGASLSNLVAIVAARDKVLGEDASAGTLYLSRAAHYSLAKAARIAGIRPGNVREIPVDGRFRMRVDLLGEQIRKDRERGLSPFLVCATAGTLDTGAIDPMDAVADVASREGLWFHVDGAYGAAFRMLAEMEGVFAGMERADSLAVDPHKGLFLAYGTGALVYRDAGDFRSSYAPRGVTYLPDAGEEEGGVDFCSVSPELSRPWRGLRIWLPFKLHGIGAFREALREKRELALEAWKALEAEEDVEIAAPPELSLFAFRQTHEGASPDEENRRNRELLERINRPRRIFISGSDIDGRFFLRLCVLHLRTGRERVMEALDIIRGALAEGR